MITFSSAAPVLPVSNMSVAVRCYESLGFSVRLFEDGQYAFASRGEVHLHLATVERVKPESSMVSVYLYVSDALALHSEWTAAGVDGRHVQPVATGYGLLEGAYVDPDGNLLRFGSPIGDVAL